MVFVFLKNLLQLLLSPGHAWEDIAATVRAPRLLVRKLMYPLIVLASISVFMEMIYDSELSIATAILRAAVDFVSLFLTFYFGQVMYRQFLYHMCDTDPSDLKITNVVAYAICLMSLSTIICNVFPIHLGLTYLLPLGVTLIVWKSEVYLTVKEDKEFLYVFFVLFTLIVPPVLIQQIFFSLFG